MKALILAAGYATRLYPLTKDMPKPLLDIAGRPMVDYILDKLENVKNLTNVYIVTNARFYPNFLEWKKTLKAKMTVDILNDGSTCNEDRLGAIGDIDFVINERKIDDDLIVIAGDNLFEPELSDMQRYFEEKKTSIVAFYDIKDKNLVAKKFGVGILDKKNRILDFEEKPEKPGSTLAATMIYFLTKEDVRELKKCIEENRKPDNGGDFIRYLAKKKPVYGYVFEYGWFDIGSFEQLEEANRIYKMRVMKAR